MPSVCVLSAGDRTVTSQHSTVSPVTGQGEAQGEMGESSGTPNPGLEEHTRRGTEMQRHSITHEGSYGWIRPTPSWAQCE